MNPLSWSAYEHEHLERGQDWYIALGVIAICTALTALIFGNFFFALLIIVASATLGLVVSRPPELSTFTLSDRGLLINDHLYMYQEMNAFWVQEEPERLLLIDTPRIFAPDLVIPIPEDISLEEIHTVLSQRVPEVPLTEPWAYKLLQTLGF